MMALKKTISLLLMFMTMFFSPVACADLDFQPDLDSSLPRTFFGHYEQNGSLTDGPESIEWYVLDDQDGDCLLLSKYILDARALQARDAEASADKSSKEISWKTCSLRDWLNGEFYDTSFSGAEKDAIDGTLSHGQSAHDTIFLLDSDELDKYIPDSKNRIAFPTQSAINNKLGLSAANGAGEWWIRSPARSEEKAAKIGAVGLIGEYWAMNVTIGVRPCVWVAGDSLNIIYGEDDDSAEEMVVPSFNEVGSTVTFGHYEQDGDLANGQEPVQWIVLETHDRKSLLLSKFLLDYQPYNTLYSYVRWSSSTIRSWLNDRFLFTAFSDEEINAVAPVQIHDDADSISDLYDFTDGTDSDYLFLLNRSEAEEYFESHRDRTVRVTTVIDLLNGINQRRKELRDALKTIEPASKVGDYDSWWLRDNTAESTYAPAVTEDGDIYPTNRINEKAGIRPALWVNLDALPVQ